ncbi:MAG: MMPL family transporter [Acidobacteria bacterium]|nr:MMPL family transporter [Acidobacteriota bacterium]
MTAAVSRLADSLGRLIVRHRGWVIAAFVLTSAAMVPGVARLETSNAPEDFFVRDAAELRRYARLTELFGSDATVRVAWPAPAPWTAEGLRRARELEQAVAALPGVLSVIGPFTHHGRFLSEWPPPDPASFRALMTANRVDRELGLVSRDGNRLSLLVTFERTGARRQREQLAALDAAVARHAPAGALAAGMPLLDRALDRSAEEVLRRYFPGLAAAAVVLLLAVFRDGRALAGPLLLVAFVELATLGAMGYAGERLNLVLAILPPLLFVIALATAIHLATRVRQLQGGDGLDAPRAVRLVLAEKRAAVAWTAITTAVGFGSLATSRVGPVLKLGLWSIAGITLLLFGALTLLPALLATGARPGAARRDGELRARRFRRRVGWWVVRRRALILGGSAALAIVAVAGMPRLRVESNALTFLAPDHPLRRAVLSLEREHMPVVAAELLLELPQSPGAGFLEPAALARLRALAGELRGRGLVLGVIGPADIVDEVAGRLPAPLRGAALAGILRDPAGRAALGQFVAPGGAAARITVFTPMLGHGELSPLFDEMQRLAHEHAPAARASVTGQLPLLLETHHYLLRTLAWSFASTLVLVALVFLLLLRDVRLTLLALLPNVWPVLGVLGLMGWRGIPLDVATVMVASVVLGLAVDDTIHTLAHFRELAPRVGATGAVVGTLEITAPAYVFSGAVLAGGFAVLGLSDFAPTARFGVLCAVAIAFAVAADLFMVPALFARRDPVAPASAPPASTVRAAVGGPA